MCGGRIRQTLAKTALTFGIVFLLFLPTIRYEQLNFDDDLYVRNNAHMRDGLTPGNLGWALTSVGYAYNWHPLAWTSLMSDVSLVRILRGGRTIGDDEWQNKRNSVARVMHFHNVVLHAANAALLFLLMGRLLGGKVALIWPFGLALLWAVHPLRVEVVSWIAERKELLSCSLMLATLLLYTGSRRLALGRYASAVICAALAMMAKPVAVTLPAVLFAWDWIFRGRIKWLKALPFALLSVGTCCLTMMAQTNAIESAREMGRLSQIRAIFTGPLIYLWQTLWPTDLSIAYEIRPNDLLSGLEMALGVLLVIGLVVVCLWWLKRRGKVLGILVFGISWVYMGLMPMLGFVKVGGQEHSDRYTYWIGCGVCVTVAMLLRLLVPRFRAWFVQCEWSGGMAEYEKLRKGVRIGTFALAFVLALMSASRMRYWRDTVTLYRDAIPKSWNTEIARALAGELIGQGPQGLNEAEEWLRACIEHHPNVSSVLNLVDLLLRKPVDGLAEQFGRPRHEEARILLEGILEREPENDRAKRLLKIIEEENRKAGQDVQRE